MKGSAVAKYHLMISVSLLACSFLLSGCPASKETISDEMSLPDGVEVVSLGLDEDQSGELPAGGRRFSVKVKLNRALTTGEYAIVAFAVRDQELIAGKPLCVGWVGVGVSDGVGPVTREDRFELVCEDGKVAGHAVTSSYGEDEWDRSSGERSTGIYVQHLEGIKTFLGMPVGIKGVKSNRITIECPH